MDLLIDIHEAPIKNLRAIHHRTAKGMNTLGNTTTAVASLFCLLIETHGLCQFSHIPSAFTKNAHSSAVFSMVLLRAVPAPWPALVSMRMRTGGPSLT